MTFGSFSQSFTAYSRQHSLAPNPLGLTPDSIWILAMELVLVCLFHSILQSSLKLLFLSLLFSLLLALVSNRLCLCTIPGSVT